MKRIGLVGFGSIAEHGHLPAWRALAGVEVVAVADVSPARLDRARALLPEAALYDSPLELISRVDPDGIDICTPPGTHLDLILAACRRGTPAIVCEKPLVLSEDDYLRVAEARARSGSRVISIDNWRHSDLNRHVLGALRAGAIGEVECVELRIGRPGCAHGNAEWMPAWRTDRAYAGGGIILDHGWHQLYLLLGWVRAPLEQVSAVTRTVNQQHFPVEDEAVIQTFFPCAEGRIELSWARDRRTNGGVVQGSRGTITIHDDRVEIDGRQGRQELAFQGRLTESSYHPSWFEATFWQNVLNESREAADRNFSEAGVLVSAIRACYRSAREKGAPCRPVFPRGELAGVVTAGRGKDHVHGAGGSGSP